MRIGLTGANGFLGRALSSALRDASIERIPISLPRSPQALDGNFLDKLAAGLDVDAVFHLAAVRHPANAHEIAVNAQLPALLEKAILQARPETRFIHLSSINAVQPDRTDSYSASKRQAEAALAGTGAIIIRPGIIWSWAPDAGGDAGRLRNYLNRSLPFFPVPFPGPTYKPVLVEQLASRIVDLLKDPKPASIINAFGDRPLTIWDLAKNSGARLLPVPTGFIEKFLPRTLSNRLPVVLRNIDLSVPSSDLGFAADETWNLPFTLPSEKV